MTSIVVPAHNEAEVIGRLLGQLVPAASRGEFDVAASRGEFDAAASRREFDVIVVANGCTDNTAELAAAFAPAVRVLSIPVASKYEALIAGYRAAAGFPRIYVDADVELRSSDVRTLDEALRRPGVLAAAPQRKLALAGRPWLIRWYYDVWTQLPEVRDGLFGRGVIGVSEPGHARIASLLPVLADDLAASLAFAPDERMVVRGASVVIHPPRTFADLLRRRVRTATAGAQIEQVSGPGGATARTRPSDLLAIARSGWRMAPRVAVFVAVAMLARIRARRAVRGRDFSTWLRDESSRC